MERGAFQDSRVIEASARFVCIRIDTGEDEETPRKYEVEAVPALFFLRSQGDLIAQCATRDPEEMAKHMEAVARDYKEEGEGK